MFWGAAAFNGHISKWDVTKVTTMNYMFWQATSFKQQLCRDGWVNSKASKIEMFKGSARTVCKVIASEAELKIAVAACLMWYPAGDRPNGLDGPIGTWDVSRVTNMDEIFNSATSFNDDISQWDVSSVTTMNAMFAGASLFNSDLSKWDVSRVVDMSAMFWGALAFNDDISKWDVSGVTVMTSIFWDAASFNGIISNWDVLSVTTMTSMFNLSLIHI